MATEFTSSAFAYGAVVFSRLLYVNLDMGLGCSLLAGLAVDFIIGIYILFFLGEALRKMSKFVPKQCSRVINL